MSRGFLIQLEGTQLFPPLVVIIFILAAYVIGGRLCVQYVLLHRHKPGVAAAFLTIFWLFWLFTIASYARAVVTVLNGPGLVPLANDAESAADGFYRKDVYVCEPDGHPRWCFDCQRRKPDRAHHSARLGRCIKKMDHLCPWVGGVVSETSFNFFAQFTFHAACLGAISLAISVYCLTEQLDEDVEPDGWVITAIIIAGFIEVFAGMMAMTSFRFIASNMTHIEMLNKRKRKMLYLAVRIPKDTPSSEKYASISFSAQAQAIASSGVSSENLDNPPTRPVAPADTPVAHRFAILQVNARQNPWNLGFCGNWRSVMGGNLLEWILPIKHSPCCYYKSTQTDYPVGPLLGRLRERYGLPEMSTGDDSM